MDQFASLPLRPRSAGQDFKPPATLIAALGKIWPALIGVAQIDGKGRGVVALVDIPAGSLIERCPVLIIPEQDRPKSDATIIFTYVFMWEHGTTEQDLYRGNGRAAIALGLSSLLNHAATPNATFTRHIDDLVLEVHSKTAIRSGEEITIDYQMALWF